MPLGAFRINSLAKLLSTQRSAKTITAYANSQISTAQSKFSGASALFDGNDYVTASDGSSTTWQLSGDFTAEFWVYQTTATNATYIDTRNGASSLGINLVSISQKFSLYTNGNTQIQDAVTFALNTWHHVALVRSGSTWTLYKNGTSVGTYTNSSTLAGNTTLCLGTANDPFFGQNGSNIYLDEVRISNTARYTTTFTPSTTPFVNDANTLLLLHMDGTNATAFFDDDNGVRRSLSIIAQNNAQINTSQSQFGGASIYLPTTNSSALNYPTYTGQDISQTGDLTVEAWFRVTSTSGYQDIFALGTETTNRFGLSVNNGRLILNQFGSSDRITGSTTVTTNTWHHAAAVRVGSTITIYLNGTSEGTYSYSGTYGNSGGWRIGPCQGGAAWIDEVRISDTARYTTTFTPSITAFANDSNTLLLIHADEVNGCRVFRDDNGKTLSAVPVVATITAQANTTSTASTITIPSTASSGDIAILFDTSTTTTDTIPSGWTSISGVTTTGIRQNVSYKILSATDPNTSVTGMAGTTRKVMVVYRGNTLITNVLPSVIASQATTATPTNQTLTGEAGPMIAFAVYSATGAISTRGWSAGSPTEYSSVSTSGIYVKALITNSGTPSTTTISMSDSGTNALQSFRLKLI